MTRIGLSRSDRSKGMCLFFISHCAYAVSTARNDRTIVVAQSDSVDQAVENG